MSSSIPSPPLLHIHKTRRVQAKLPLQPPTNPILHPSPTVRVANTTSSPVDINRREATLALTSLCLASVFSQFPSLAAEESATTPCSFVVADSGLAFCDKAVGYGPEAVKGQLIKAHYTGRLENGKVFDSSYNRGKPLTFRVGVGEVIKGWDQGIIGGNGIPPMLTGGKRTLKIPPELGYGMRGAGCKGGSCIIPPDSTLLFDVEFVGRHNATHSSVGLSKLGASMYHKYILMK